MKPPVALGCRVHSGWAAVVALGGAPSAPEMIERARLVLIDREAGGAAQPYHAAAEMDLAEAESYLGACAEAATALAREGLEAILVKLRVLHVDVAGCGILFASGRQPGALASTLASHAMIHTAEGEFFRSAIARASDQLGLPVTRVKEREVWEVAEGALALRPKYLETHLASLGKKAGPPWRQDQKLAAMAAWMVLGSFRTE